jgi:hypothetical protein
VQYRLYASRGCVYSKVTFSVSEFHSEALFQFLSGYFGCRRPPDYQCNSTLTACATLSHVATYDLKTDDGLRAACEAIGQPETWPNSAREWIQALAETIRWVRSADEHTRAGVEFQQRLWEDNHVAAVGQGNVSVERALQDPAFRNWIAATSLQSLPAAREEWSHFLGSVYKISSVSSSVCSYLGCHTSRFSVLWQRYIPRR